jgi:hypothetical protein
MSEVLVEHDLIARGFNVARPLVVARYDLIAERDGRMYRVQTKTGRIDPRSNALKASFDTPYSPEEIDVIAVVDGDSSTIYYVKAIDLVPGVTNVTIRFERGSRETTAFSAEACLAWPYRVDEGDKRTSEAPYESERSEG